MNGHKVNFSLILILISFISCIAQKTISFTIEMEEGYRPSGNGILLSPSDSSYIVGEFFLDGELTFNHIPDSINLLKLTSLEFRDTLIQLKNIKLLNQAAISIFVKKGRAALNEITINAKKPTFIQKADGTVFVAIAGTTLAASSSTEEILSKSPEVLVDENGEISVFGRGTAIVFLNKQKITTEQLSLITPSQIISIEIIRNPSSRYDAEGGAVILIRTKQLNNKSSLLALQTNSEYSSYSGFKSLVAANFIQSAGKWTFSSNADLNRGFSRFVKNTTRTRSPEYIAIHSDVTTAWEPFNDYDLSFGLGLQFQPKFNRFFTLQYSGNNVLTSGNIISDNTIITSGETGVFNVDILRDEVDQSNSFTFNMEEVLDTIGSSLFLGAQYYRRSSDHNNPIAEAGFFTSGQSDRELFNTVDRSIGLFNAQLDYTNAKIKNLKIESGVKYGHVSNNSDARFLVKQIDQSYIEDEVLSNTFGYDESILGAYLNYRFTPSDQLTTQMGIRTEFTNYQIAFDESTDDVKDNYLKWFPSISIQYKIKERWTLGVSYSESIIRQNYNRLNPALIYQDPYTSIQGNPLLLPEKVKSIELNSTYNGTTLKAGYRKVEDPFAGAALPGMDSLSYILIRLNLEKSDNYYINLSKSIDYKRLTSSIFLSQSYTKGLESEVGLKGRDPKPQFYIHTTNRLNLGSGYNFEMLAYYYTALENGTINRLPAGNITLSLDKKVFNNALTIRLIANDILHTQRADGDYRSGVTDITFTNKWDSNYFRMALNYDFSKANKPKFKGKNISNDALRRI